MRFLGIPWKSLFLSVGMIMVSIWSLYLGAVALFEPSAGTAPNKGPARGAQHQAGKDQRASSDSPRAAERKAQELRDASARTASRDDAASKAGSNKSNPANLSDGKQQGKTPPVWHGDSRVVKGPGPAQHSRATSPGEISIRNDLREAIINEAVAVAIKSKRPWLNLIAVSKEQYRRGDIDDARAILIMAEKMAVDPDDQIKSSAAVREVVKAMLMQKLVDDAVNAMQNIQNTRERERAVAEVAAWSARLGEVDTARNLILQIANRSDRDVALVSISESEAVMDGVVIALQTVNSISDPVKQDDAYRRIAIKRGKLLDFSGAEQAVQLIRNDRIKDTTVAYLARQRVRAGDLTGGLTTLRNVSDQGMADTSLRELAVELARLGRFRSSAYVSTRIRDDSERSYALESLSVEQARSGDLSGALVRADAIPNDLVRERTLRNVSSVTADKGNPKRARNVAIKINSPAERDRAYRAIAQAAAADGDHVTAYNTLQDINRPDEKALALVSMARTRQRQGDERQALALLEDANREAGEVAATHVVDRIQSDLAVAYAERQEADQSLSIAEKISDVRQRDNTYGSLARTLAKSDLYAAQQSINSISSDELRRVVEDAVARTWARQVSPQDAVSSARELNSGRQQIIFLLEVSRKT